MTRKDGHRRTVTGEQAEVFEKMRPQLEGLCNEIKELSKKKPDGSVNKFKLGMINEKLEEANSLLEGDFRPFKEFRLFDEDNLPSNSDVVVILSQYVSALNVWRSAHTHRDPANYNWYWNTTDRSKRRAGVGFAQDEEE